MPKLAAGLIVGLVLIAAAVLTVTAFRHRSQTFQYTDQAALDSVAVAEDRNNIWLKADYLKFRAIESVALSHGGELSDSDLDWLLAHITQQQSPKDFPPLVDAGVLGLIDKVNLTDTQKSRVYATTLPLLSHAVPGDRRGLVVQYACTVMTHLADKRAIPALVPLLKYPRLDVRRDAADALKASGYAGPIPTMKGKTD